MSDPPHFLVGEFFTSQGWNVPRLREWVPEAVVQRIATIFFSPEQDDVMVWVPSPNGDFSVSSAWEAIRPKRSISLVDHYVWGPVVPLKVSFFAWRLLRRWLPLDCILQGKGVTLGSRCNCCQQSQETVSHLFLHGTVAKAVWEHFLKTFGLFPANSSSVASLLTHWFLSHSKVSAVHVRVLVPLLVLWFIWKSRNLARFQAGIFTPTQVISQIEEFLGQMGRARAFARPSFAGDRDCPWASLCNPSRRDIGAMLVSWEKPLTGWLKLNSDASVINGKAAGGGVLRDHWGRVVWAYYKEFGDLDVLAAEAQSLLFGLQLCVERGVSSLIVESDSRVLVQLVGSKALSKWPLCTVLREITHHIGRQEATLLHVFREANAVADALASLQLGEHRLFESLKALPSKARGEARLDCHGVPRIRTGRC